MLLGLAPSWSALAAVLFVAGALDSIADAAENAHGLRVERLYRRSILNSMHGVWSIGAVVGGSMGAAAIGVGIPLVWHLAIASALFATVAVARHGSCCRGWTTPSGKPTVALAGCRGSVACASLAASWRSG